MAWIAGIVAAMLALVAAACWLARRPRRSASRALLSPITQQHLHLLQGGKLSEAEVECAKAKLSALFERGDFEQASESLQSGLDFAIHVQALAELGGPEAASVLEWQLQRRLSDDPVEQSWYWIDLAHALRMIGRSESAPPLLRCPASTSNGPLSEFYAAETACCPGFVDALRRPGDALGRAALQVLHRTLKGVRSGVPPHVIGEGRLGQAVVRAWKSRQEGVDPRLVRVLVEALRLLRRAEHYKKAFCGHAYAIESLHRQIVELARLEDAASDFLSDASWMLIHELSIIDDDARMEVLLALHDLRADAASVVLAQIDSWPEAQQVLGLKLLQFSRESYVGHRLCERLTHRSRHSGTAILQALRGHPFPEVEAVLLQASVEWDPSIRAEAVASLGWWEPYSRTELLSCLQHAREDSCGEVRDAAQAALARLGERRALQWFRQLLVCESDPAVLEAIRRIAAERLTLLWPDLDSLAEADATDVSQAAREALEQMREEMAGGLLVL